MPDHPELAEIFLTIMLPAHAAQVGKFMEHFMLTNMTTFINKLNIFFSKQPAQIRKILACLNDLTNEPELKMDQIKTRVLPLLKGNALLIDWVLQCFPTEQYPDSPAEEYEYLNLRKAIETLDDPDVYEHLPQTEICPDPVENPCHLRYMNGRIYYGSRVQLPGKLSFVDTDKISGRSMLTATATHDDRLAMATSESSTNAPVKSRYRCMHSIRQYGNLKIKEQQRTHMDAEANCASGEEHETNDDDCSKRTADALNNSSGSDASDCCDDITFKAHAIRLNPSAHTSTSGLNAEDTQNLLKLVVGTERLSDADREALNKSPKKISARHVTSSIGKILRKSPKKIAAKSPTNKKTAIGMPSAQSHAIQTAKKLKKLIETPSTSGSDDDTRKPGRMAAKGKKKREASGARSQKVGGTVKAEKVEPVIEVVAADNERNVVDEQVTVATNTIADEPNECEVEEESSSLVWSRDEDKLVLEQIKQGFSSENELIEVLVSKLVGRTYEAIYDRFKFLMDVIAKLRADS